MRLISNETRRCQSAGSGDPDSASSTAIPTRRLSGPGLGGVTNVKHHAAKTVGRALEYERITVEFVTEMREYGELVLAWSEAHSNIAGRETSADVRTPQERQGTQHDPLGKDDRGGWFR